MNQILATQKEEEKKQKRGKKTDIKKVIKVSSVLIITFGIVIAGQGIWNVINSNAQPEFPKNILSNVDNTQNQNIDNNQNNNQNIGNDLPEQNGNIEQYGTQIELAVVGNKLKITAKNIEGLNNLIYRWNNGEDIETYARTQENTKIEVYVDIPIGRNTITIVATDLDENQKVEECEIVGTTKPEIRVSEESRNLVIHVSDAEEIVTVEFTVNSTKYRLNLDDMIEDELYKQVQGLTVVLSQANRIKEINYMQNLLKPGTNEIVVTAENKYGTKSTYKCQIQLD